MQTSMPTTTRGYAYAELNEPARAYALHTTQRAHTGRWDLDDVDQAKAAMATALAAAFGLSDRGWPEVEVTVWDSRRFSVAGTLSPTTATALPWAPGIQAVILGWPRRVHVHTARCHRPHSIGRMRTAVAAAIADAWQTAHQQVQRRLALEWIATGEPRFSASGRLLSAPAVA